MSIEVFADLARERTRMLREHAAAAELNARLWHKIEEVNRQLGELADRLGEAGIAADVIVDGVRTRVCDPSFDYRLKPGVDVATAVETLQGFGVDVEAKTQTVLPWQHVQKAVEDYLDGDPSGVDVLEVVDVKVRRKVEPVSLKAGR